MEEIFPGVWLMRLGKPEDATPQSIRKKPVSAKVLAGMPKIFKPPVSADSIRWRITGRGTYIEIPQENDEEIYGFGLQLFSFRQSGLKRQLRVNSDPPGNTGESHAPVPFWVSTKGYGVYIDTSRYASVYCGSHSRAEDLFPEDFESKLSADNLADLYRKNDVAAKRICVDIPVANGVDIYFFSGPSMLEAVQRYNLFSGGGCLPTLWGLGVWYRPYGQATGRDVMLLSQNLRKNNIPCDVIGLEPGWQTKAYSCSLVWDEQRFAPEPEKYIHNLNEMGYNVNLWEHVFVHTSSPIFGELKEHCGPSAVWGGLVPDMLDPAASQLFTEYHAKEFVKKGVTGFKLDECDNSDYIASPWSFPECDQFPSGVDGEQMHSLLGLLYQDSIEASLEAENIRTYSLVRSSHGLASPRPFVLYSDLYDHKCFIRGLINSGFSGLLWTPEVRSCESSEDLIRRVQTVVFSPMVSINAWYLKNPPWKQVNRELNNVSQFMENYDEIEAICRRLFELRMRLIPYLYSAFAKYYLTGIPPFRALVLDYPDDPNVIDIDNEYMIGESLLVAPLVAGEKSREVYLPAGNWYCFWSKEVYKGGCSYQIEPSLEHIPVFIKDNSMLPLADVCQHVARDTVFKLTVNVFGEPSEPFVLFADDGVTYDYTRGQYNLISLSWNTAKQTGEIVKNDIYPKERYTIKEWKKW